VVLSAASCRRAPSVSRDRGSVWVSTNAHCGCPASASTAPAAAARSSGDGRHGTSYPPPSFPGHPGQRQGAGAGEGYCWTVSAADRPCACPEDRERRSRPMELVRARRGSRTPTRRAPKPWSRSETSPDRKCGGLHQTGSTSVMDGPRARLADVHGRQTAGCLSMEVGLSDRSSTSFPPPTIGMNL
jgi:hypothetical protein